MRHSEHDLSARAKRHDTNGHAYESCKYTPFRLAAFDLVNDADGNISKLLG